MSNGSGKHTVITGDTFAGIARIKYGTETQALRISSANPGATEPLVAGTTLIIPSLPNSPKNISQQTQGEKNEVALLIDGKRFRFWQNISITRSIDAMDTLAFTAPFQDDKAEFRTTFKPFSFKSGVVTVSGEPLFTGTLVGIDPTIAEKQKILAVSGYSLPGVLNDCTAPASVYDKIGLETDKQTLKEIATTMATPFGLGVLFTADAGPVFKRVEIQPTAKILGFLTKLAQQQNLIISSSENGELLFQQSIKTGKPVAVLQQGTAPVLSVIPLFDPQNYYSHITGIDPALVGTDGGQFTVKNSRLSNVIRPFTFKATDTEGGGIKKATEAKAARMFANTVSYSLTVPTWRDPSGKLWQPNTTLKLQAPGAMIYSSYEFLIRSIEFNRNSNSETATLNLVLPGAFSGELPKALPWD